MTNMWRAFLLMLLLVLIMGGALFWDYNVRQHGAFVYVGAFFGIGIVSFFGFLFVSRDMRRPKGDFEDGDVRLAIVAAFVSVFFAMLAFFMFSPVDPTPFARTLTDSFLSQTALVVGFYFATSGALEFVKLRQSRNSGTDVNSGNRPKENQTP